jgi:hypothetical protein
MSITYAKVGGPPQDWHKLQVRDLDSGDLVRAVEVNTEEGWALVWKKGSTETERRTGRFAIEHQPNG